MKKVELRKTGEKISIIGQGTWGLNRWRTKEYYEQWKKSLRRGIELEMNHIDTAEVYGFGKAEVVIRKVIAEYQRDDLFITSKLFFTHFTRSGMKKAAYKSLKRLNIDYFDLYLIHWPVPFISIKKQMKVMEELVCEEKTRYIGVSNFSVKQFIKAQDALKKTELVNNQLKANVMNQKHIHESLPYYQKEGVTMTAYSPLGHKGFTHLTGEMRMILEHIATNHHATIQQIALAWLINHDNVIVIPKAIQIKHVEVNAAAAKIKLISDEIRQLSNEQI